MEVTDRPLLALVPVLAAVLAIAIVAILQGDDAVAIALPSFLTVLPLLGAGRTACRLAAGCWRSSRRRVSVRRALPAARGGAAGRRRRPGLRSAALAAAALLGCLLLAGCGTNAQPAPSTRAGDGAAAVRTLYVQAPLSGPAVDEGRAMVDAVRLAVDQQGGLAGRVRIVVRALDDGGSDAATDPARCARNAATAAADPRALAVIGTYELACSERALKILRPAGILLVSPLNARRRCPGRCVSRPRSATRARRPRNSRPRSGPRASPSSASGPAPPRRSRSASRPTAARERRRADRAARRLRDSRRGTSSPSCRSSTSRSSPWPGRPGPGRRAPARAGAAAESRAPRGRRAAVLRHARVSRRCGAGGRGRARDLALRAGGAARRQRAQLRARPTRTCTGEPPPVAAYAADAAGAVLAAAGTAGASRPR